MMLTVRDTRGCTVARLAMRLVDLIAFAERYGRQRGALEA